MVTLVVLFVVMVVVMVVVLTVAGGFVVVHLSCLPSLASLTAACIAVWKGEYRARGVLGPEKMAAKVMIMNATAVSVAKTDIISAVTVAKMGLG